MKKFIFALSLGLILTLVLSIYAENIQSNIADNILRLHVLANSDSDEDQALKLKVRDRLLAESHVLFRDCTSPSETKRVFLQNREMLEAVAKDTIENAGYAYPVSLRLDHTYFPMRHYGNVALPAGEYDAVRVEIGEAAGKNWWCVMFPPLCFVDGSVAAENSAALSEAVGENAPLLTPDAASDVQIRFRVVDFFQTATHVIKSALRRA